MKKHTLKNGLEIEFNIKQSVVVKHIMIEIPGKYDSQIIEAAVGPDQKEEEVVAAQIESYVKQTMPNIGKEIQLIEDREQHQKAIEQELAQNKEQKDKYLSAIIIPGIDKDGNGFADLVIKGTKAWDEISYSPSRGDIGFDSVESAEKYFEALTKQVDVTKDHVQETREEKTLDRDLLQKALEEGFTYFVNVTTENGEKHAVLHDIEEAIKAGMEYDSERGDKIFDNKKEAEEYIKSF